MARYRLFFGNRPAAAGVAAGVLDIDGSGAVAFAGQTIAPTGRTWINVAGTWKEAVTFVNVAGTWKQATVYQRVAGDWKRVG